MPLPGRGTGSRYFLRMPPLAAFANGVRDSHGVSIATPPAAAPYLKSVRRLRVRIVDLPCVGPRPWQTCVTYRATQRAIRHLDVWVGLSGSGVRPQAASAHESADLARDHDILAGDDDEHRDRTGGEHAVPIHGRCIDFRHADGSQAADDAGADARRVLADA